MPEQITLYTARVCPWAQRVCDNVSFAELALHEAKLPHKRFEIDLKNKPDWYAPKVNPASKVPAIAYGGPDVDPADPSPESQKIAESRVIMELIADLDTTETLLPKDPIARAKARFFIETATPLVFGGWYWALTRGDDPDVLLKNVETLQSLLPAEGYAIGRWSIADAAVTPFLARAEITLKNDLGKFDEGKGRAVWAALESDPKYARFRQYFSDLKSRQSFKDTFYPDLVFETFHKAYGRSNVAEIEVKG